ncbi:hypothetical protein BUZ62_00845 [Staphylococcus pasteuri]|uniref:hypothetical protein n=1 Tax=Staphylococcus pasteuri TaxID=45972 RepID=UPI000D3C3116|nr:hypothetical protein [Staphylococcus pasteuri]MEB7433311.1 hypothetical protein [Staphylococcus pasteuri]PTU88095.1 hypothetical protein BUZ62_00845 [Staphylococcus pasteuri]
MAETIKTSEHYYTKDFSSWGQEENNFVANQELTVTITLNEYRDLIEDKSKKDKEIDEFRSKYYKEKDLKDKVKEENRNLKNKIYALQNDEAITSHDEEEED